MAAWMQGVVQGRVSKPHTSEGCLGRDSIFAPLLYTTKCKITYLRECNTESNRISYTLQQFSSQILTDTPIGYFVKYK